MSTQIQISPQREQLLHRQLEMPQTRLSGGLGPERLKRSYRHGLCVSSSFPSLSLWAVLTQFCWILGHRPSQIFPAREQLSSGDQKPGGHGHDPGPPEESDQWFVAALGLVLTAEEVVPPASLHSPGPSLVCHLFLCLLGSTRVRASLL